MFAVRSLSAALMLCVCVSSALAQEAPVPVPAAPPAVAAPAPVGPPAAVPVPPPEQAVPAPLPAAPVAPQSVAPQSVAPQYAAPQYAAPQYAAPAPDAPLPPAAAQPAYGYDGRSELTAVEMQLAELRQQRPSLGGPIALTAVGGGVAFLGAYVAMLAWMVNETDDLDCDNYGSDYDYNCDEDDDRRLVRGMALMSLAGLGTMVGGLVWMSKRLQERRALKPEIDALRTRRNYLLRTMRYGLNAQPGRYGFSVGASF